MMISTPEARNSSLEQAGEQEISVCVSVYAHKLAHVNASLSRQSRTQQPHRLQKIILQAIITTRVLTLKHFSLAFLVR